jgi:ribonuclease P protein component
MLKSKYRLPVKSKATHSSVVKSQTFLLKLSQNNLSLSRFGFIISKKIDKRAVIRNRTKRVIRSCIEEMLKKIKQGYDMLFILQKSAVGKKRYEFYNEIEKLLSEKQLINK